MIAFVRELPERRVAIVVRNLSTGLERTVLNSPFLSLPLDEFSLEWSRDSRWIIAPASWPLEAAKQPASDRVQSALYAFSALQDEARQLTEPSVPLQLHPSLSADGKALAYFWHATSVEKIRIQKLDSDLRRTGPPVVLDIPGFEEFHCRAPTWLRSSGRLAFLSTPTGHWQIWTIQLRGGKVRDLRLSQASETDIVDPSYTRDGRTLIFTSRIENTDTWRIDRSLNGATFSEPRRIQNSTRQERHPEISPDGRHIAFESDRSGLPEIWISDLEGAHAFQLTHFSVAFPGSPRWSPDSRTVVFDARVSGHSAIFQVDASAGARPLQITSGSTDDRMPCFSADGKWIYFDSRRSGSDSFALWRIPNAGGRPELFLDQPDFSPTASVDGKFLYVIGGPNSDKVLRRVNISDRSVENLAQGVMDRSAALADDGVYALAPAGSDRFYLLFVPQSGPKQTRVAATLTGKLREGLSVRRDGATIIFTRQEQRESDLMLVRNFR